MKKIILAFIIGGIVFGTITGVVAYNYNAKNISYTPSDENWNVNNVEDAIKDLKNNNNSFNINNTTIQRSFSHGSRNKRTTSMELQPGAYLIYAAGLVTASWNGGNSESNSSPVFEGNCNKVDSFSMSTNSDSNTCQGAKSHAAQTFGIWYCEFDAPTTIKATAGDTYIATDTSSVYINALKIN